MVEQAADNSGSAENAPEKPVEEKSSAGSINIQEEYVHELHSHQAVVIAGNASKYCLLDEARLAIVHFDLTSPPPDL